MMVNLKPLASQGVKYSLSQTLRCPKRRDLDLAEFDYGPAFVENCLSQWSRAHDLPSLTEDILARNDTSKFVKELSTDLLTEAAFHVADNVFWKRSHLDALTFEELLAIPDGLAKTTSPG